MRAFYVEVLGFTVKLDYEMDAETAGSAGAGARWLMLTPPGGGPNITLTTWSTPPGTASIAMSCDDASDVYKRLTANGLVPHHEVRDAPWGRWFGFDDPDGNGWLVVQQR